MKPRVLGILAVASVAAWLESGWRVRLWWGRQVREWQELSEEIDRARSGR